MFHVQHLLGVGHQRRSAAIARALAQTGIAVDYVSGGMPVPDLELGRARLHQLAPARAHDASYALLEDARGRAVDDAWKAHRRDTLLALAARLQPSLVVTETYPFGRGLLAFELEPLIEWVAARDGCRALCSVRDIIEPRRDPARRRRMLETVRAHYAAVLVHGDPGLLPFSSTFPEADELGDRLHHTGYVLTRSPASPRSRQGPVLVSCGGGRVGEQLLELALRARGLSACRDAPWQLRTGGGLSGEALERVRRAAPPGVAIESATAGFLDTLAGARLSLSQAGYNTVAELLATGTPAVLVPFGAEREQGLRAEAVAQRGLAEVVAADDATPRTLAAALDLALRRGSIPHDINLDGVSRSVQLIRRWLE